MRLRLLLCVCGVVLGVISLSIGRDDPAFSFAGSSWVGAVALLGAGWALLSCGLGLWARRSENAAGPVLVAASFAWFIAELDNPGVGSGPLFTVGLVLFAACSPLVAWAVLAYPSGRLGSRVERLAVVSGLAVAVLVLGLFPALFFDPTANGCAECPTNLLLVSSDPRLVGDFNRAGMRLGVASSAVLIAVAMSRFVRPIRARGRPTGAVVVAGCSYLGLVGWTFAVSADRGFVGTGIVERRLWLAQATVLAVLAVAVGWGRVRAHRARASLARLVVELEHGTQPGGLRDALADIVGDPDLAVAYPLDGGRCVDVTGRDIDVAPCDGRTATPLIRDGAPVAVLVHRSTLLDDPELVEQVVATARLALENEHLQASLRAREEDLRASRARIVESGDSERRRLERDLHDGAQQRLVSLRLGLSLVRAQLGRDLDRQIVELFDAVNAELQRAIDQLREVGHGIHPAVLSEEGLAAAVEVLAEHATNPFSFAEITDARYSPAVESAAYRVVAEAVRAGATRVSASSSDGLLRVDVDASAPPDDLVELEDRVGALDGRIRVEAGPFRGVTVHAELPCE